MKASEPDKPVSISMFRMLGISLGAVLCAFAVWAGGAAESMAAGAADNRSYALQLNSFRLQENAERLVKILKKEGYNPYVLTTSSEDLWYKVRVGPYLSRESAGEAAKAIEKDHGSVPLVILSKPSPEKTALPVAAPQPVAKKIAVKKPAVIKKAFDDDEIEVAGMELATPEAPKAAPVSEAPQAVAASPESAPVTVAQTAPAPEASPVKVPAPVETAPQAPQAAQDPNGNSVDVVLSQFLVWLQAWQKKQMDSYFAFYSKSFQSDGVPYKDWQASRARLMKESTGMQIEVNDVIIQEKGNTIEMSFIETFQSDNLSDIRHKVLIWKKEGDHWKIVQESSKPA